jgi:hypothetical protein
MAKQDGLASWIPKAAVVRETGISERGLERCIQARKIQVAIAPCRAGARAFGLQLGIPGVTAHKTPLRAEEAALENDRVSMLSSRKRP